MRVRIKGGWSPFAQIVYYLLPQTLARLCRTIGRFEVHSRLMLGAIGHLHEVTSKGQHTIPRVGAMSICIASVKS
jgi:hypothetical protein